MRFTGPMKARLLALTAFFLVLSACTSGTATPPASPFTPTLAAGPTLSGPIAASPTPDVTSTQPAETPTIPAWTPEPQPADWKDIPINPVLDQHIVEIFKQGQAQGRDPHAFSVIGDCQAIPFVFMGPIGRQELLPDSSEQYLWDAIHQFEGSFNRWSVSARGGFTAASLLSPIQADPHYCMPGETPLACEVRLNNPAYAFITLETWLDPNTIDRYQVYLRQILDYLLARGIVPIMLTKADSVELSNGTHVINPAIVKVAYDYDIPVINFWRSAQYLPNAGIDPNREGFHLSQDGYNLKNILALRTLYNVWKAVDPASAASSGMGSGTASATPTAQAAVSNPPSLLSRPDCSGGCIFFATASAAQDGAVTARGVYAYEYGSLTLVQVLGQGFDLQDVSEDGKRLLVNEKSSLYILTLADDSSQRVSSSFYWMDKQGAYWNSDDSQVVFLDQAGPIQTPTGAAIDLFPTSRDNERYIESGTCTSADFCQSAGVYRLGADNTPVLLADTSRPVFSPDGSQMAYLNPSAATQDNYFHISYLLLENPDQGASSRRVIYFPVEHGFMIYPDVREVAFSPDSSKLMVIYDVYSAYFEKSQRLQTYLLDSSTGVLYDFGSLTGGSASLNPHLVWSLDGKKVLFFLTDVTSDNQYVLNLFQTRLDNGDKLAPFAQAVLTGSDYFYVTNLYWRAP